MVEHVGELSPMRSFTPAAHCPPRLPNWQFCALSQLAHAPVLGSADTNNFKLATLHAPGTVVRLESDLHWISGCGLTYPSTRSPSDGGGSAGIAEFSPLQFLGFQILVNFRLIRQVVGDRTAHIFKRNQGRKILENSFW